MSIRFDYVPEYRSMRWSAIAVVMAVTFSTSIAQDETKPNVIVILADDLGYGDLSCYGGWINTPGIDSLANSGIRFTDFHSSGTVCSPTRAGFVTGLYQQRVGIPGVVTAKGHRDKGLSTKNETIASRLSHHGYRTALFGKWHLGYAPRYNPIHHGFDQFKGYVSGNVDYFLHLDQTGVEDWWHQDQKQPEQGYVTHLINKHAVEFIKQNADQPFFLYVAHEAPHYPYQGPNDKPERTVGGKFDNHGSRKDKKQAYREMVEEMDKGVRQLLSTLEDLEIRENTFVIFFSDNGATKLGSNGPLRGFKSSVWEGGHRVPAIVSWPAKLPKGATSDQLAISLDLLPTVLAATDTSAASLKTDGINLLPLLGVNAKPKTRTLFWRHGKRKAVRKGDWKLVVENPRSEAKVFDLSKDIGEQKDLASTKPELTAQLLDLLKGWENEVGPDQFGN